MRGYAGKILWIDLSRRSYTIEPTANHDLNLFIGGRGLGAKILFEQMVARTDPLSPENLIILGTGPLTGTFIPGAGRHCIITKSPQTGYFVDSYSGGFFGPEMKFAGYDFILISGKADKPSYLRIRNHEVDFKDARHLWGKNTYEVESILKKEVGDDLARSVVIGPAGENLSSLAMIQNDYYHQAGRGGTGAVFGSKNLKAIVIRGTGKILLAHPEPLLQFVLKDVQDRRLMSERKQAVASRMRYGTPSTLAITDKIGILPTRNFQEGRFEGAAKIDAHAFEKLLKVSDKACFCCNLPCNKHSLVKEGPYKGLQMGGPQYETLSMLGANLGIDSIEAVLNLNYLCDNLGMDTIGAGNVVAFAIECYREGLLGKEDFDGLKPKFGDPGFTAELLYKIAFRKGIGDLLAQGVKKATQAIGKDSQKFAMHIKGLEFPGYKPGINSLGFALAYAITERGACHRRSWVTLREQHLKPGSTQGRASLVKELYDKRVPLDSGVLCTVPTELGGITIEEVAGKYLYYVTGQRFTRADMDDLADRVATLLRLFNLREGLTKDEELAFPARTFEAEATPPNAGKVFTKEMLQEMVEEYYRLRGWNRNGIPHRVTLERLGLSDFSKK
jgi:aldehyde:ferredoxin oxidoreductase